MIALFALFMILAVGGVAAAVVYQFNHALDEVTNDQYQTSSDGAEKKTEYRSEEPLSFVILGRDTREGTGSLNTDVMMVAVANPQTQKVTLLSLPRDTRVKIPGYRGYYKINAVFANGEAERRKAEARHETPTENGITLTKKTLESMLGIPIQHYVEVNFEGFKAVIDELGGIEVNVDRKLVYDDPTDGTRIYLEPGLQVLNGEQALGYVRHRLDNRGPKYYSSDFDRNRRQQEVVKAVMKKLVSFEGIPKILSVLNTASQYVRTDLSKEQIKGLVYDFRRFNPDNLVVLENGAVWNAALSKTLLPRENMEQIRATLMREMGVTATAELSDAAIAEYAATEVASERRQQPKETAKPVATPAAKPQQQQDQAAKPADEEEHSTTTDGTTPPADSDPANPAQPADRPAGQPSQPPAAGDGQTAEPPNGTNEPADGQTPPNGGDAGSGSGGSGGSATPPPDIAPLPGTAPPA
jgi:LCP family protein required for cell wall assembly